MKMGVLQARFQQLVPTARHPEKASYLLLMLSLGLAITLLSFAGSGSSVFAFMGLTLQNATPIIFLSLAVGLTIAAGQIDISTASLATLSAVLFACSTQTHGLTRFLFYTALVLLPFIHAAIAGWIIAMRRGPALIVTWALGVIYFSAAGTIAQVVTSSDRPNRLVGDVGSIAMRTASSTNWLDLTSGGWQLVGMIIAAIGFIVATHIGGVAKAIGSNRQSSKYIGVNEVRSIFFIFLCVGVYSSFAGWLFSQYSSTATVGDMVGYELIAVAVAVLGGTVMSGGYYSTFGIVAAALVYQLIINATQAAKIPFIGEYEARLVTVLFAFILVAVSALAGKLMSGDTYNVVVRSKDTVS